jgi:hypothetical protein
VYTRHIPAAATAAPPRVHVYIDGDGIPWLGGRIPAGDPTPRYPLALSLMTQDTHPSIYLGRPCYHGLARDVHCGSERWTSGRYGADVVDSMAAALTAMLSTMGNPAVTLIGHSGGGVLALWLADAVPAADTVITIGANLDIDAWTSHHGWLPLHGSKNPARHAAWRPDVRQIHLAGARDEVVPLDVTEAFLPSAPSASLHVFDTFDHVCCWVRDWPVILSEHASGRAADSR